MKPGIGFSIVIVILVLAGLVPAPARAANDEAVSSVQEAVRNLRSADVELHERARLRLADQGPLAVSPLMDALAAETAIPVRARLEQALQSILAEQLGLLAAEYERVLRTRREAAAGEDGKPGRQEQPGGQEQPDGQGQAGGQEQPPAAGSTPLDEAMTIAAAETLTASGPFAATQVWRRANFGVGWQREVAGPVLARLRERFRATSAADPEAALRLLKAADHMGAPFIAGAARDPAHPLNAPALELLDGILRGHLQALASPDSVARLYAASALLDFQDETLPLLDSALATADPDLADRIEQLRRRITWGVDDDLYARIGHAFEGYEDLAWWRRRSWVHEIASIGGAEAIPALRAVLARDPSLPVKVTAAQALATLGEPTGAAFLQSLGLATRHQDPSMNIPIYMSQGIKYLEVGRYEEAESEFLKIVELEPKNEVAHYNLACTYSLWGKSEKALGHLRAAIENGFTDFEHIDHDPDLNPLRELPEFKELMAELKARFGGGREDEEHRDDEDERPREGPGRR